LASAAALLKYYEYSQSITFAAHTMKVCINIEFDVFDRFNLTRFFSDHLFRERKHNDDGFFYHRKLGDSDELKNPNS
jgi:hypothetical protein